MVTVSQNSVLNQSCELQENKEMVATSRLELLT
jgi:hypothetical protein